LGALGPVLNKWRSEELVALYKKLVAKYFVHLANHHDNFDNYNNTHHPWNSTRLGPKKELVGGLAKAAKKHSLHFGVSVHAAQPGGDEPAR
jgi:alpha-L-fucosidase